MLQDNYEVSLQASFPEATIPNYFSYMPSFPAPQSNLLLSFEPHPSWPLQLVVLTRGHQALLPGLIHPLQPDSGTSITGAEVKRSIPEGG